MIEIKKVVVALMFASNIAHGAVLVDASGIIVGYTQEQCSGSPCHGYGFGGQVVGTGPQGVQGKDGPIGPQGPNGLNGSNGAQGPQGLNGANGLDGTPGTPGTPGTQGVQGAKGDKGDPGAATPAKAPQVVEVKPEVNPVVYNVGAEVRWADFKHFSLNSGYRYDMRNHGQVVDAAIVQFKIGSSYEQRRLDKLEADLRQLQRQNAVSAQIDGIDLSEAK